MSRKIWRPLQYVAGIPSFCIVFLGGGARVAAGRFAEELEGVRVRRVPGNRELEACDHELRTPTNKRAFTQVVSSRGAQRLSLWAPKLSKPGWLDYSYADLGTLTAPSLWHAGLTVSSCSPRGVWASLPLRAKGFLGSRSL